jgi:hypothetical protein
MARLFSSLQRLERNSAVITGYPYTIAAWVYDDGTSTNFPFLVGCSTSGTTAAGTRLQLYIDDLGKFSSGVGAVAANSTVARTANTWAHGCGVHASATSHAAFLNGGSKGTNAATQAFPTGMNRTTINAWNGGANVGIAGNSAHCAIWNVALADAEVLELANGLLPTRIRPQSIISYWACNGRDSGEIDPYGRNDMTNYSSTVNANVPRISMSSFIA